MARKKARLDPRYRRGGISQKQGNSQGQGLLRSNTTDGLRSAEARADLEGEDCVHAALGRSHHRTGAKAASKAKKRRREFEEEAASFPSGIAATAQGRAELLESGSRSVASRLASAERHARLSAEHTEWLIDHGHVREAIASHGGAARRTKIKSINRPSGIILSEDASADTQWMNNAATLSAQQPRGRGSHTVAQQAFEETMLMAHLPAAPAPAPAQQQTLSKRARSREREQQAAPAQKAQRSTSSVVALARRLGIPKSTAKRAAKRARLRRCKLEAHEAGAVLVEMRLRAGPLKCMHAHCGITYIHVSIVLCSVCRFSMSVRWHSYVSIDLVVSYY